MFMFFSNIKHIAYILKEYFAKHVRALQVFFFIFNIEFFFLIFTNISIFLMYWNFFYIYINLNKF